MLEWRKFLFYFSPVLLLLLLITTVHFKTDLSAFIIAGENAEETLLANEMQSGALSRRYLISVDFKQEQQSVANNFTGKFKAQLKAIKGVAEVWSVGQQADILNTVQSVYSHYAGAFYSLNPQKDLPGIFNPEALAQRAVFLKNALLSPQAPLVKKIAKQDPLLLTLKSFESDGNQLQKQIINKNSQYLNLILETDAAGLDASQQSRIQAEIYQVFKHLIQGQPTQYQLEMTGVPVFAAATQNLIQGDITLISVLSSVALMLLFLIIFRSISALVQVFTLLIIIILSAILITSWAFGDVHIMTIAIGSTLVGICIDYPIHAIAHAQAEDITQRGRVIARIWPSMVLGGVTTLIGYMALGVSGYPGFQQVSVYAATGIILALFLTRFVLPILISTKKQRVLSIPAVDCWMRICSFYRPQILFALLIVLLISIYSLKSLHWMQDLQELTPELNYLKQNDKRIRSRMVSIEPGRFILISGQTVEAVLQKTEQVYPLLDQLKQRGALTDYIGLYPWLLSARQQQQNLSLLQQYLTDSNVSNWQQAIRQQGLSLKHLGRPDYSGVKPLTLEKVFKTPVKRLVDSRIMVTKDKTVAIIWLAGHQPEAIKKAFETVEGARYFSQRDLLNNMTQNYTERAQLLLLTGLMIIILILIVRYKSLIKSLQTLAPALMAAFFILGFWAIAGVAISFLHLVGYLLVVAICVDYGIFYQENRSGNLAVTYQAMAASMLTSALAFGCLSSAESTSLKILASVVALGVLVGFLLCPVLIKHPANEV